MTKPGFVVGSLSVALAAALTAEGRTEQMFIGDMDMDMQGQMASPMLHTPFAMLDVPLGEGKPPTAKARPASLSGSTIAALAKGSLVIDGDSGALIRLDDSAEPTHRLKVGAGASQLVVDRARDIAFVADRFGDRIVVADVKNGVKKSRIIPTRAEPYGVALSPDGNTLLVTTVADRNLTAYDATTGDERWSLEIGPEPRGVAISPDGTEAMVTLLTTGAVARVSLDDDPSVSYIALSPPKQANANRFGFGATTAASEDAGRGFARGAFATTYIGHDLAIVPHQISTPHQDTGHNEVQSSYGGGGSFNPPIAHRVAWIGSDRHVALGHISVHQPRAVAYDAGSDTLFVAGYGSEQVMALSDASQASVGMQWTAAVNTGSTALCGPNGLAIADDGNVLVYCELTQTVATLATLDDRTGVAVAVSKPVATTKLTEQQQRGRAMFRAGNDARLSTMGAMACASCHPEGRTDGLSWRIEGKSMQTPLLAGRLDGAHPFKWDGGDKTLDDSLRNTVTRLGGTGITSEQADDLEAFLLTLEPPRPPTTNTRAAARGKKLFESDATGCATCHSGALLSNGKSYDLADDLPKVDTPSLIGLSSSAPYYHDGSASTLHAVLLETGTIHGMGNTSSLSDREVEDLIAYLQTL
jgi:DNA-binding beta-propeller fold protein YncE/mono/diheme cytochrome c family protein